MNDPLLIPLLLRVQQLQSDYLAQAYSLAPTIADVAEWLCRLHAMPVGTVDPDALDPALPQQLLALPLFRHYLVSVACGPQRRYIIEHLPEDQAEAFGRLALPAHEFGQVLHQWNDCLFHLQNWNYRMKLVEQGQTWEPAYQYQVAGMVTFSIPEFSIQYMTLCALPPTHVENRKMLRIGGPGQGFTTVVLEAYPLRGPAWMLRPKEGETAG